MQIKWPRGKTPEKFYKFIVDCKPSILQGSLLAIDPASKECGWAHYRAGVYEASGVVSVPGKMPIQKRLKYLYDHLPDVDPDVVVIEHIRGGMAHDYLKYAVAVTLTKYSECALDLCPIPVWKALAKALGTVKSDEMDARMIAEATILLAKGD